MPSLSTQPDNRQRVLDATDIVEVVGDHVALKPKGREFVGLCAFHDDHSPSMYVVPHKQIFHCFACGAGGNAIDFMMRLHAMGFLEALQSLAQRAGIELERSSARQSSSSNEGSSRDEIARANSIASSFFQGIYNHQQHGASARDCIHNRDISSEMVESFQIGAAPDRWDGLLSFIQSKNLPLEPFIDAGLLKTRAEGSGQYDALRNRLIFPILDQTGRPIAFGGRRINDEDEPKYLNSPETKLFDKGSTLFGMHQASRTIRESHTAIICEGYTDVIACHQAGFTNAIATLGTALTKRHAPILRRLCDTVILLFDGDDAGQRAADRALEVFFTEPVDVRIAVAPGGLDPDDLLRQPSGTKQFQSMLDASVDFLEYRFSRLRESLQARGLGIGSNARARAIEEEIERLVQLGLRQLPPIRQSTVVRKLTRLAGVDAEAISKALASAGRGRPRSEQANVAPRNPNREQSLGVLESALACLLVDPALLETNPSAAADILRQQAYASGPLAEVAQAFMDEAQAQGRPELAKLLLRLDNPDARSTATSLLSLLERETQGDREKVAQIFSDCRRRLHLARTPTGTDPQPNAEATVDSDKPSGEQPDDELVRIATLRTQYESHGGNPLAMPRPRAGPT